MIDNGNPGLWAAPCVPLGVYDDTVWVEPGYVAITGGGIWRHGAAPGHGAGPGPHAGWWFHSSRQTYASLPLWWRAA